MMTFTPDGLATALGSFPHTDVHAVCRLVLDYFPDIPVWPQLPRLHFRENMYVQFTQGLPCLVIDEEREKIFFDTEQDTTPALEAFYERIIADDVDYFALTPEYAAGFYAMAEHLRAIPAGDGFVKGHVTGPVSLGLTITDETRRASLYNDLLADALTKTCAMKARWQIRQLKSLRSHVIIFIDEPYLASFGSAYVSLNRESVVTMLNEVVEAIHAEGGMAGIHCCGNTDWPLLTETQTDIISFDAYHYVETIALYPAELEAYLKRGGVLAWGIVPTSEAIVHETEASLVAKLERGWGMLQAKGLDPAKLLEACLITPSCGAGPMTIDLAEKLIRDTAGVSSAMRAGRLSNLQQFDQVAVG
jgi:hypothetical protein